MTRHLLRAPCSFLFAVTLAVAALGGCSTFGSRPSASAPPTTNTTAPPPARTRPGGYYLDDGPGANPPADLDKIPDAVPKWEPLRPANARPYVAMGMGYRPLTALEPYKGQGLATWYGRRYHGKPTASGEPYDMYAMTAAHAILPIPSYARVTNLRTGSAVVVRINDRGPFVEGRIIDVSYTAAHKLGILAGATMVEVESIIPAGSGSSIVAQQPPPVAEKAPAETSLVATPARPEPIGAIAVPAVAAPPPAAAAPPPAVGAPTASAPSAPAVATTTPATAAPTMQTPITTEGGRVFVQLGAFASRENADALLARLKSQVDWLALQIVSRDGLHHVQAGPYANQSDARQAAERVVQALGIKPMVQVR